MPARMPVLRGGEREQIRVIAAQHRELRAAAAVALARLRADPVEPVERRAHAGRIGMVRVGPRAGGRDGREVVADVGAHREREARFVERLVEVRMKARERGGGADRMHEAARHRLIRRGARARHDAARAERAVQQVPVEAPRRARTGRHRLRERERTRDPRARLSARMLAGQRVAVGEYGVADRLVVHVADHADERIGVGNGARAFVDRPQAACASRAVRRAARGAVRRRYDERRGKRHGGWCGERHGERHGGWCGERRGERHDGQRGERRVARLRGWCRGRLSARCGAPHARRWAAARRLRHAPLPRASRMRRAPDGSCAASAGRGRGRSDRSPAR